MVSDSHDAPSPLSPQGEPGSFIPIQFLAICGNVGKHGEPDREHGYDVSRYTACPSCGSFERIMVAVALGPQILHRRIIQALRVPRQKK